MLEIHNLSVAYSGAPIFTDLSVTFANGRITGIIGPNGAGKSTMIKGALGLIKTQRGTAKFCGQALGKQRGNIAYVEQHNDLDLSFPINVFDFVLSGTYAQLGLFKSPGKREHQRALAALERVNLSAFRNQQIGGLSGGQLQRVFVARAIAQDADLVILDEPFVGIDMHSEQQIMTVLHEWRDAGKTVIVVHHDLNKVSAYFDDLVILNHGLMASGPVAATYTAANIERAFSSDLSALLFTKGGDQYA
ncbi:MAG: metal ABC transporter ATP-binding protein [Lacticaseibacillus songhuajiangensis]|nr:metal ABC transporter ATP-binding protein [Lacticaseibacillus songhuajiangensis]